MSEFLARMVRGSLDAPVAGFLYLSLCAESTKQQIERVIQNEMRIDVMCIHATHVHSSIFLPCWVNMLRIVYCCRPSAAHVPTVNIHDCVFVNKRKMRRVCLSIPFREFCSEQLFGAHVIVFVRVCTKRAHAFHSIARCTMFSCHPNSEHRTQI